MFKPLRTVAAVAAVAGAAAMGGAAPSNAEAAVPPSARTAARCYYEIPSSFTIKHSNTWTVQTGSKAGRLKWNVSAWYSSRYSLTGKMRLTRFDVSPGRNGERPIVEFTVTLSNGSAGVYTGTINRRGFIVGTTTDEFHRDSTARFWVLEPVDCV